MGHRTMETHFQMKGNAPRLALKKRYKATRKWRPICTNVRGEGGRLSESQTIRVQYCLLVRGEEKQ